MRFFVPAKEIFEAADVLTAAEAFGEIRGGYVFDAEPLDLPKPTKHQGPRCDYHDLSGCVACHHANSHQRSFTE